ncbi:hypothetical protein ACLBWT_20050 [Paenibacillus sp. D51F]
MKNIAILTGYNPEVDKDAVGQYSEMLHSTLNKIDQTEFSFNHEVIREKNPLKWMLLFNALQKKYDLIHLQYPIEGWGNSIMPGVYPVIAKILKRNKQKKVIATFHEWSSMHYLRKGSVIPLSLLNDGLIFVSNHEQSEFMKSSFNKISSIPTSVIPIGVNLLIPDINKNKVLEIRDEYTSNQINSKREIIIGYFGFIYDFKQPYEMLEIIKRINDYGEVSAKLVIAGDFPDDHIIQRKKFLNKIEEYNLGEYVVMHGFIKDEVKLAHILSACNVVLLLFADGLTTRRSSFWYVLELGIPVITTSCENRNEFNGILDIEQLTNDNKVAFIPKEKEKMDNKMVTNLILNYLEYKFPEQKKGISPNWNTISEMHIKWYSSVLI